MLGGKAEGGMVEIVILKPWESPPASGDKIVIVSDSQIGMMTTWRNDRAIAHPDCLPHDQMLERAREEAEKLGIATVYVREAPRTPKS
jgi:hypothetical protein